MPERMTASNAYPLAWPEGWPRTPAHKRERERFSVTFARARDGLIAELRRLGGRLPIISTDIEVYEKRGQLVPYANQKEPSDSGVAVYFTLNGEQRVIACDRWTSVRGNLQAIKLTVEALRGLDRWGSTDMLNRVFTGFQALPAAAMPRDWRTVLHLIPSDGLTEAERSYRALARTAHPDRGGSNEQMAELNAAIRQAREELGS